LFTALLSGFQYLQVSRENKSLLEAMTEIKKNTWDNERIEYALPPFMALVSLIEP